MWLGPDSDLAHSNRKTAHDILERVGNYAKTITSHTGIGKPPGLLAGPLLGAAAGEMAHGREWRDASRIGVGTWIGLLVGAIFKVLLALAMLVIFIGALVVN